MWQRDNSKLIFENSLQAFNNNNNNNNNGFSWGKRKGGITYWKEVLMEVWSPLVQLPGLHQLWADRARVRKWFLVFCLLSARCCGWVGGAFCPLLNARHYLSEPTLLGIVGCLAQPTSKGAYEYANWSPWAGWLTPRHFPPSLQIRFSESQLRGFLEMPSFPSWLRICRPLWRRGAWTAQLPTALASAPDLCLRVPWWVTPTNWSFLPSLPATSGVWILPSMKSCSSDLRKNWLRGLPWQERLEHG